MESEFTLADVINYIQDHLLTIGIFIDGDALSEILALEQDFFEKHGMIQCFMELEGEKE